MIKATGRTGDGRPLLLLGLSGENMTRLMADEPILIDTTTLGPAFADLAPMVVAIYGGRSEEELASALKTDALTGLTLNPEQAGQ